MKRRCLYCLLGIAVFLGAVPGGATTLRCPLDSVKVGDACVDKYEASVWQIPPSNGTLIRKVQFGRVTLTDLTNGGATQVSPASTCSPTFPATFDATGNWTSPLFAVSVAGVLPTSCVTWFQADQACALSGKRLLTNEEWQRTAAGTPDPGTDDGGTDCNIGGLGRPLNTGSRAKCVSNWGAFDMVGNVEEWVADWLPQSTDCPGWGAFSDDLMCLAGASATATGPSALVRGGGFTSFIAAGVFALDARPPSTLGNSPALARKSLGFRCARTSISTPATTPTLPCGTFLTEWGTQGNGDGQFFAPVFPAVDGNGSVFVADAVNARIQKFTNSGTFVTKWGSVGVGDGQFIDPQAVAVDGNGNVFVADRVNDRVEVFTNTGTFLTKWGGRGVGNGQFNRPQGIAVDRNGNVFVADTGRDRIQKFTSTGTFLATWGSTGTQDGQFEVPFGVAVDADGNVFVADAEHDRIQKFTNTGTFLATFGSTGTGDGQFDGPFGVAVDRNGNIFVTDAGNSRIEKFTNTGIFLGQWGSLGSGDGQFDDPIGLAVDRDGNVFVGDFNNRIQKFACP